MSASSATTRKPKLAVFKFASCDGCQLSLLDREDELLALAGAVDIAYFLEASRAVAPGPYDLALVEGSITTPDDVERIHEVRRQAKILITIGACATAGGIQALRNALDHPELAAAVYPDPGAIEALATSTPIASHVHVDYQLRGCPIDSGQLLEVVAALLQGRPPRFPDESVCLTCKRRGLVCVQVAHGAPCLGPLTQAGCGALCPAVARGCYGCFGPASGPNPPALTRWWARELGVEERRIRWTLQTYNAAAPAFEKEAARHDR